MNNLHQEEYPATVFLKHKVMPRPSNNNLKCPGCHYEYPNDAIKRHICPIFNNTRCKGCHFVFPNKAMKRHLFTYYKCKQFYEQNNSKKKELNDTLKERNLADLDELPQPIHCLCIKNIRKCQSCDL